MSKGRGRNPSLQADFKMKAWLAAREGINITIQGMLLILVSIDAKYAEFCG